ncbi:ankyrin protein [Penicillium macrosclerotiorum]|uniref:ankyrin protein n=1 Tax=Penicillium macrosclerotiorum TaxID=303699 RepID=UPI002548E5F5|nr:ankyrin protein [Penicillium macrosclerotiorum]KAJ5662734.1 ankyrin protein [Penicillium macrosclerotiorum]
MTEQSFQMDSLPPAKEIHDCIRTKVMDELKNLYDPTPLVERLYSRSNGNILWVHIVVRMLARKYREGLELELLDFVDEAPADMNDLYREILHQLCPQKKLRGLARAHFQWVLCAKRPMTVQEYRLGVFGTFGPTRWVKEESLINEFELINFKSQVDFFCGGLIKFVPNEKGELVVEMVDQSAQDFLNNNPDCWFFDEPDTEGPDWASQANLQLAAACMEYICSCDMAEGPTQETHWTAVSQRYKERLNQHQFLQYASLYWTHHLDSAAECIWDLWDDIVYFMEDENAPSAYQIAQFERQRDFRPYCHPIHLASILGHTAVLRLFLENGVNVDLTDGFDLTPLAYAAEEGHLGVVKLLVANGANVNHRQAKWNISPEQPVKNTDTPVVQYLLDSGAALDQLEDLLHEVASFGHIAAAKSLNQIDLDIQGTPLQAACTRGNTEIAKFLIDTLADVNLPGGLYGTPLQAAAAKGHASLISLLLDHGATVNINNGEYGSPLQAACAEGYHKIKELLLHAGADVNLTGGFYGDAMQAALAGGHPDIAIQLLDEGFRAQGVEARGHYGFPLQVAAWKGNTKILEALLNRGADVNSSGGYFGSALQAACSAGCKEAVDMLIANGANLDHTGGHYGTALHAACTKGSYVICEKLLECGANPLKSLPGSGTPVQLAAAHGDDDLFQMLLNKAADINMDSQFVQDLVDVTAMAPEDPFKGPSRSTRT